MSAQRIAMWSGPRNISTALMRSFGSRDDTVVCDEPLYAHFLLVTGREHPGREEVLRRHESDWRVVARGLTGPLPPGKTVFYQKHMAHHLLPDVGREWLDALRHAFLVRPPREMLASLAKILDRVELADTGLPQQVEIFRREVARRADPPPVVDAIDLLAAPEPLLRKLCAALDLAYQPAMLRWEKGRRDTDGCWGPHWYAGVWDSTGFQPPRRERAPLPAALEELCAECEPLYEELAAHRLRA